MFTRIEQLETTTLDADLCIIGGGVAGITLALALQNSGLKIVLLESGGFEADEKTQDLSRGMVVGQPYALEQSRLRYFGGCSNHWGGLCVKLDPWDFTKRDWMPHSGWPITYETLEPYYKKADVILGFNNQNKLLLPALESGGLLRPNYLRFANKLRFAEEYTSSLEKDHNLTVVLGANATDLRTDKDRPTINHAQVTSIEGKTITVHARRFILACGGMENARILLYCNKDMPTGIGNQYGLVGRYFMEHPHIDGGTLYSLSNLAFSLFNQSQFRAIRQRTGRFAYNFSPTEATMAQMKIPNFSINILDTHKGKKREAMLDYLRALTDVPQRIKGYKSRFHIRSEQVPNPESRILLSDQKDLLGLPRLALKWQLSPIDRHGIKAATRLLARILPIDEGIVQQAAWVDDEKLWSKELKGGSHHMGTTRMASDPRHGVVDADCRVHGLSNLYIAGSSVFPTSGAANPTYTLIALAIRLAEHLRSTRP